MKHWKALGIDEFLFAYPSIELEDICVDKVVLQGTYHLKAQLAGHQHVERVLSLKIVCPKDYPNTLPTVYETEKYFPRTEAFHTYADGSLCLGSDLKIKSILRTDSSLTNFFDKIVARFLYAVSHRIEFGTFPYGELAHGEEGLIDDYSDMLGLAGKAPVLLALKALSSRKRVANKLLCPCQCGKRLGSCQYRFTLNEFRKIERRRWFRSHLQEAFTPIEKPKKRKRKRPEL